MDWIQGEDCWRDKKKACVIRYTQGNKLAFIDAVNDYKRLKANRKKMK